MNGTQNDSEPDRFGPKGWPDGGGRPPPTTVALRLWTPARTRVVALRLFPEVVVVRRQDRRHGANDNGRTQEDVLTRCDLPGEIRQWLSTIGRHPAGRTVLQISLVTPDRPVWDWAEVWCRHRLGWYRSGFGDGVATGIVPVDQEELRRQVSTVLLRRIGTVSGARSEGRE
jgi:hypothetical protein